MANHPVVFLINPPIYDFAAYDLWAKPLGLLYIAAILKQAGCTVKVFDYMVREPAVTATPNSGRERWGCGRYSARIVPVPAALHGILRPWRRYGKEEAAMRQVMSNAGSPDLVLVSSGMTYWYPGVQEAVHTVKSIFPGVSVILGGNYASLCSAHAAANAGADAVFRGSDIRALVRLMNSFGVMLDERAVPSGFSDFPAPDFSAYAAPGYAVMRTSTGCPFRCSYCAIDILGPQVWERKNPATVIAEMNSFAGKGIHNIALYDDALLVEPERHLLPILEGLKAGKVFVNLHSPNGLHTRYINKAVANAMYSAKFVMPRLSLETVAPSRQVATGGKVSSEQFLQAAAVLGEAGYRNGQYAAYVLMGMPGQDLVEVEATLRFVHAAGGRVELVEYSLIPGTRDWETARHILPSDDPLWHNNSLLALVMPEERCRIQELKTLARNLNRTFS